MLIEVLAATTTLWLALMIMGQSLVFDEHMLRQADQRIVLGMTARNCCRYVKSLMQQKGRHDCPKWFRHPKEDGDWLVRLSGESCLVSWSNQGNYGHFTLLV